MSFKKVLPLLALGVVLILLTPAITVLGSWLAVKDFSTLWQHLLEMRLVELLGNTLFLALGVALFAGFLGTSLAWLNASCEYPGRRLFEWMLMLPLAIPVYVLAFVFLGIFGIGGTAQSWLGEMIGAGYTHRDLRTLPVLVLVMGFAFYPYVYIVMRVSFLLRGVELMEAARAGGYGPLRSFLYIVLPASRPALAAGLALVLMETLADFGAVSIFNYDTFTVAIYQLWFDLFEQGASAQLASILLLLAVLVPLLERQARGRARYTQRLRVPALPPTRLKGAHAWLMSLFVLGVLLFAFILPCAQLVHWAWYSPDSFDYRYWDAGLRTLSLALIITFCTTLIALFLCLLAYRNPTYINRLGLRLSGVAYALPGTVLAAGWVLAAGLAARYLPETGPGGWVRVIIAPGSLVLLILACTSRFMLLAVSSIETGLMRISKSIFESARSLGAGRTVLFTRIFLPLLAPSLWTAVLLVFVETMREMPATLLLRPFGWDTLAVRVFEMSSEGLWEKAAMPALLLVCVGFLPIFLIWRKTRVRTASPAHHV